MALTKEDLISISCLLEVKLADKLTPVEDGINDIKSGIERLEVRVGRLEERMDGLEERMDKLEERMDGLEERMDRLEERVDHLEEKVETFGAQVRLTRLEMENIVGPQIQLLAENYVPAAKRYEKTSSQIDGMQSDIDIMKHTITRHSEILQRLA